jgi:hypothetical protein
MNAPMPPMAPPNEAPRGGALTGGQDALEESTGIRKSGRAPSQRSAVHVQLQDAIIVQTMPDSCSQPPP